MGLFSVLNVILEKPMEESLKMVKVSDEIRDALTKGSGPLAPVYELMKQYEAANWQEVSRILILRNMNVDTISEVYLNALSWYKKLI